MTPKEKAEKLVEKFWNTDVELRLSKWERKKCALIAVDEIKKALGSTDKMYWQEVKQEIENL